MPKMKDLKPWPPIIWDPTRTIFFQEKEHWNEKKSPSS